MTYVYKYIKNITDDAKVVFTDGSVEDFKGDFASLVTTSLDNFYDCDMNTESNKYTVAYNRVVALNENRKYSYDSEENPVEDFNRFVNVNLKTFEGEYYWGLYYDFKLICDLRITPRTCSISTAKFDFDDINEALEMLEKTGEYNGSKVNKFTRLQAEYACRAIYYDYTGRGSLSVLLPSKRG